MHESDVDYCLEVRNACLQIHPRLMNLMPGSDVEPGFNVVSYSPEIEAEVDSIYKQMYDEHITIDEVISLLQRNKNSSNPRDHEIFSCMLHFLFDEYKFFQSYYPPRELAMTGYLFGSLIQYQLVDYIPLGVAIRYVLDALNCPPETNLFKFGLQALVRFESRLPEWQPLCQALMKITHLLDARPELVNILSRAISMGSEASNPAPEGLALPGTSATEALPAFTSIRPDPSEGDPEAPPEEISDKILFIVNNLAPSNFDSKLVDMKEQFQEQYSRWFANYLVDQRVSTEPNNHQLYLRFLDALNIKALFNFVLHETFVKSAVLLNSEKTLHVTSERTILKNVGAWLGSITLARDRPIKHKNLSFKDLLIEGYDNGRLIVAIPFVCKTLEPCARSKVFRPPNPWLMAVVSLLAELYHYADLKLNLKFEIEVLCKSLEIDLDTVQATTILRNRPLSDAGPPLPDYVGDIDALPMGGYDPARMQGDNQVIGLGPTSPSESQRALGAHIENILANVLPLIMINPALAPLNTNQTFKRAIQLAVERSIREVSCRSFQLKTGTRLTAGPDHRSGCRALGHDCWYLHSRAGSQGLRDRAERREAPSSWSINEREVGWKSCTSHLQGAVARQPCKPPSYIPHRVWFRRGMSHSLGEITVLMKPVISRLSRKRYSRSWSTTTSMSLVRPSRKPPWTEQLSRSMKHS